MEKKINGNKNSYHGCFMKIINNPAMVLLAKNAGMNFLFYDMEHGMFSFNEIHTMSLIAKPNDIDIFVRVPECTKGYISRALDAGATAVMVPMVETVEQAKTLVEWSKYPPIGKRGYAGGANTYYAPSGNHETNMKNMNSKTLTIAQIETCKGLENAKEIISMNGIDAIIVGPADLSISLGIPDNKDEIKLIEEISKIQQLCMQHDKYFGIIGKISLLEKFSNYIQIMVSAIDINCITESLKSYEKEYERIERKEMV
ncbi:HpcH/HpaI aldolase family protein [Anaerorhabdus sp.]|uniref:HpcH/HpaI aldolase family protein n=1 Tax=Anaerorhabdus sp. TaxID=1872524 RepID=UPI002FCA089E